MIVTQSNGEMVYVTTKLTADDIKNAVPATSTHPHLCLLKLWVQDCEQSNTPHKCWMFKGNESTDWHKCEAKTPMFVPGWEYKRINSNCLVNNEEAPLGIETREEFNALYRANTKCSIWVPDVATTALTTCLSGEMLWNCTELDHLIAKRLMYVSKLDAIKRAEVMIKWDIIP
jgi:hypothetical protein